ncbi:(4Fe-4S)-binding protein [Poritiphilus flavus]|uniref:Iron-binding zinc finger CDGSH type domain-containing protein n=1 Tax=Poritiphilus flavus TaxID=2697053 RepID=A0A6L9EE29_9FLAO|nr:(4Fe-4S)-binding protein [Poritiphilus flavus]NAS12957.1 hypothetical protein [Poritiphilus flavus]
MSEREIIKEYSNGELTVVWKPKKCIHSGICVQTLPEVYDPNAKPWIKAENASTDALKSQIDLCPSGALSYYIKGENKQEQKTAMEGAKVEVIPNGPLIVQGELEVKLADGSQEAKKRSTAFCRCGASETKPYCDGTHNTIGFKD